MKQQRLKLIIITASVFLAAVIVTVLFAREIFQQSALLREQVTAIAQDQAQQNELDRLKRLTIETADDRATLSSYYLASQSDSIDFLNYVEALAADNGVALETRNPAESERRNGSVLTVDYSVTGTQGELDQFISLLENMPYVSELNSLQLSKQTGVTWGANISISVLISATP